MLDSPSDGDIIFLLGLSIRTKFRNAERELTANENRRIRNTSPFDENFDPKTNTPGNIFLDLVSVRQTKIWLWHYLLLLLGWTDGNRNTSTGHTNTVLLPIVIDVDTLRRDFLFFCRTSCYRALIFLSTTLSLSLSLSVGRSVGRTLSTREINPPWSQTRR